MTPDEIKQYKLETEIERLRSTTEISLVYVQGLRDENASLRATIVYMSEHADDPEMVRLTALRALEPKS